MEHRMVIDLGVTSSLLNFQAIIQEGSKMRYLLNDYKITFGIVYAHEISEVFFNIVFTSLVIFTFILI